jgi:hypothetical protein
VLRAAGETETTQENIQDWLQLDAGDPGFQLPKEEEIAAVIFFLNVHQHLPTLLPYVRMYRPHISCLKFKGEMGCGLYSK